MENWKPDVNSAGRADVSNEERKAMIASLLREREGCERRGLAARVKLIDAELRRYGHEAAKPAARAERRPRSGRSEKR